MGLPQLKLGWMALEGSDALVRPRCMRLEIIADTYLSVGTPVQVALPRLLDVAQASGARSAIVSAELPRAAALVGARPVLPLLPAEGGWSAVLQVPPRCPRRSA